LKNIFLEYCFINKFQQNKEQIDALDLIINFYKQTNDPNNKFFKLFTKKDKKLGFYLNGDVGVGKTMLLNFFFNNLKISKQRIHFNQFMINIHDFRNDYKLKKKK
jgi:cell division protein ZapE